MYFDIEKINFYLPDKYSTLEALGINNPDWDIKKIISKTGVPNIYRSTDDVLPFIKNAFKKFEFKNLSDVDILIVTTQTSDITLPGISNQLQSDLKIKNDVISFDLGLGCSGFIYSLFVALKLMQGEQPIKRSLLIFCDTYSHYIDKHDRTMLPLFSDCVSAVLVTNKNNHKLLDTDFGSDGSGADHLKIFKNDNNEKKLFMNGSEVFMFTMSKVPSSVKIILDRNHLDVTDIDYFIFHQASKIVLENLIRKIDIPISKVITSIEKYGNTVSSSIPIVLSENSDKFKKGDKLILCGFGVGLSWGSILVEW